MFFSLNRLVLWGALLMASLLSACSYSFSGASIPPEMTTIQVSFFENHAPLSYPNLGNTFTEALIERIRTQTKLAITQKEPHAKMEGKITDYDIKPISIQDNKNPVAGANRITMTVQVKYTVYLKDFQKQSYEQSFSTFVDFSLAGQTLASQQDGLNKRLIQQLTEDIFNRAFAQW
ncbi:MAG: hypothetical protein EOO99_01435 [Pedobacter sp.]|nr:MAG: hypothetical protein EOO99_01435 [Pedobacter sp.]